jgi:hypothetical protein
LTFHKYNPGQRAGQKQTLTKKEGESEVELVVTKGS